MLPRFRDKPFYLKLKTFFTAQETKNETKQITDSEIFIKNKTEVTWDSFPNFDYVSSYLHLKSFTWKQDYVLS